MRLRSWLGLGAALFGSACIGTMPQLPPLFDVPGIKTGTTSFRKELVTSLEGSLLASRIMQITDMRHHDGLLVVAENGLRWLDPQGVTTREMIFPLRMFRHALLTLPDGRLAIGGFSSRPNVILMFDLNGQELLRVALGSSYVIPEFANMIAGPELEVLVPGRLDARIFDLFGTLRGRVSTPTYTTIKTVVQADDDAEYEIAFVKTSLRAGPVEVVIKNADGSIVSQWTDSEGGWLSFVPSLGDRKLWGITSEGFTGWDAYGKRVDAFPAPDVNYLRYVIGAKFRNHTALIASGGGYSNLSVLCVFDDSERLVFQEVYSSRTYAVFADPGADEFYVGVGDSVVRYAVANVSAQSGGAQ